MNGKRAKEIFRTISSFIKPSNVGKYKFYKNRIGWGPVIDPETGQPMLDKDGTPLIKPIKVEGTIATANPQREHYQLAKKLYKESYRDGMHPHQHTHTNHRRRYQHVR